MEGGYRPSPKARSCCFTLALLGGAVRSACQAGIVPTGSAPLGARSEALLACSCSLLPAQGLSAHLSGTRRAPLLQGRMRMGRRQLSQHSQHAWGCFPGPRIRTPRACQHPAGNSSGEKRPTGDPALRVLQQVLHGRRAISGRRCNELCHPAEQAENRIALTVPCGSAVCQDMYF